MDLMKSLRGSGLWVTLLLALLAAPVQAAVITVDDPSVDEAVSGASERFQEPDPLRRLERRLFGAVRADDHQQLDDR